jgi:GGDEF domain-containing protein
MAHRERQLVHSATRDPESELPNRSIVEEHLRVAIPRATRRSDCAVLVTVELGTEPDREVVVEIAERLSRSCRRGDVMARVASGAFVVLADPVTPDDAGRAIAERLRAVLADPIFVATGEVVPQVRVSARPVTSDATVEGLLTVGQPAS